MLFRMIPREEHFFELLQKAGVNAKKAAVEFRQLIDEWGDMASPRFKNIREIESEGDLLTHEVIDRLNRTFITPIDREDIHRLSSEIDDVCDIIQALADRMQVYELGSSMPDTFKKMVELLENSARHMETALMEIPSFRKNSRVTDHCIQIKGIENEADELLKHGLADLFRSQTDAMFVIKWKEIYETIEFAHDKLSHIANTLEGIIVKNA